MRKNVQVPVTEKEHEMFRAVCNARGQTMAGLLRRLLKKEMLRISQTDDEARELLREMK